MNEFLIKVRKNIQNALIVQIATMHRSMQNPLIHSIHQNIGVVMDKFLELVAEEIKFSANEILKDIKSLKQEKKTSSSQPLPTQIVLELSRLGNKFCETGLFRSAGLFQSYTKCITAIPQKQIL